MSQKFFFFNFLVLCRLQDLTSATFSSYCFTNKIGFECTDFLAVGTDVLVSCLPGYEPLRHLVTCLEDGKWSMEVADCLEMP